MDARRISASRQVTNAGVVTGVSKGVVVLITATDPTTQLSSGAALTVTVLAASAIDIAGPKTVPLGLMES